MTRTLLTALLTLSLPSLAEPPAGAVKDGKVVKSAREELARMQKELDDQRALLVRILELQQQQYAMLVKLAKGELSAAQASAVVPDLAPLDEPPTPRRAEPVAAERPKLATPAAPRPAAGAKGSVSGRVTFKGDVSPAWVFVEDLKGTGSGSLEIKQQDKQFSPRLAAVPRGTKLLFANYDSIFHNVFSVSPGNSFDLGNTRAGEAAKAFNAESPGVIDIFCNMHSKMSASVLVVPGTHLARVEADGSFKLDDLPLGVHRVGAWAGGPRVVTKEVDVTATGAEVGFELQPTESTPHKNKQGQSYGSYAD